MARLGGDEFAVVLNDIRAQANAEAVADKVLAAASQVFRIGELKVLVGASVGVAFEPAFGENWAALVRRADAAVYRAKASSRGCRA